MEQILAESKANDLNASAELKAAKAKTETLKQEKLLNQESKKRKISVEEGVVALKMEVKSLRDAEEQNRLLRAAKKDIDLTTKEGRDTMQKFNTVIDKNTELIKKNSDSLVRSKMNVGRYKEDIKSAASEIMKGNVSLKNMGDLAKGTGGYLKSSMGAGLSEVRIGVGSMIKGMIGAQAIIGGFQKLMGLFQSGIQSIIDFEAANSKLAAALGTTSKNVKDLATDAQRLGAATKYTASEATNLQIELAKLGFTKKEILKSTEGILKFAQATGAELPEAAALAGAALRMFGADTSETERYVSAMAVATAKSALSFSYLQTAMPIVGPVARAFNFQIEDTLALLGKLSDAGFDASMSATATRNILLNLADASGKLAQSLGGPVKTLPDLVDGLKKLKDQGIDLNSTLELTDKRSVAAFNAFLTAVDKIVPLREQITGVTGELNDMADEMGNNVKGAVAGLSSAWEAFMLSFYDSKGPMKDVLDFLAKGLRETANQLKSNSQLQDEADNAAVGRAQKEMAQSGILKKNRENMARLYKEKLNEGMNADEAAIAAKEEYLNSIKSQLEYENSAYQIAVDKRTKIEDEVSNRSSFRKGTIYGWLYDSTRVGRSKKVMEDEIKTATIAAAGKKAIASITESIIEDLNKVDLKQSQISNNFKPSLTDKEKSKLEKEAKERLRIKEEYQQSELALMDDGLKKEIAKISLDYNKKMSAVKGFSDEEIATRENLAKEMQRAIEDKTISFVIANEQKEIANKLETVKKGGQEEYDLRVEQLELQRDVEVAAAIMAGEDVYSIDEKYDAKRRELQEKFASDKNKKMQDWSAVQSIIAEKTMEDELSKLADEYTKGLISKENYEAKKLKIQQKYAIEAAELAVEVAKLQLGTGGLSEDDEMALKNKLAQAEIALAKLVKDANISAMEETDKARKKSFKDWEDGLSMVGDALNAFADLGSALYERKIEEVDREIEKNQESGDAEIERIDKLAENGAITTEEAEARKRAAAAITAEKDKELAKKKADLQTKQAKMDKANAIVQSIINTAMAVMKVWGQTGIGGFALAPIVAALGAVQLATIIAQPIPKYAKGTDNHPGGLAVVGDGGKQEMIISGGKSWVTPSVPTLVDIPKGSVVLPDVMDLESVRRMKSDVMLLVNEAARKGEPVTVNVNNDFRRLEGEMRNMSSSFNAMAKYQRKAAVQADLRNIASRL